MKKYLKILPLLFCALTAVLFSAGCGEAEPPPVNRIIAEGPEEAVVFAGDKEIGSTPCYLNGPVSGLELVRLEAPGYEPAWCWIKPLPEKGVSEYKVKMRPVSAPVLVESLPSGASIYLNGEDTGKVTPAVVFAPYGSHSIKLEKQGSDPLNISFSVSSSRPHKVFGKVSSTLGMLTVETFPAGADIYLDDEKIGTSNYSGHQVEGVYTLLIALDGYGEYTSKINIVRDEENIIGPLDLKNLPGELIVKSDPAGAAVYIDSKESGVTPLEKQLDPGKYDIKLIAPGCVEYLQEVTIQSNKTAEVDAVLTSYFGSVEFSIEPADVDVVFNGEYLGKAADSPFVIKDLSPGRYIVELMHPDIIPAEEPARYTIDLQQGQKLVFAEPVSPPLADVELIMLNNTKPWKGKLVSGPDEDAGTLEFLSIDGGTVVLPLDKIKEIRPIN